MLDTKGLPVPLPDENKVLAVDDGVEAVIFVPYANPLPGLEGSGDRLKEMGQMILTDKRLIFLPHKASTKLSFESLSVQLHAILSTKFVQPMFGANHLTMELKPAPDGGLTDGAKVEIRFKDKPMFEFISVLEKSRERAVYQKRAAMLEDDLPMYSTPSESTNAVNTAAQPPHPVPPPPSNDAPPGYDA